MAAIDRCPPRALRCLSTMSPDLSCPHRRRRECHVRRVRLSQPLNERQRLPCVRRHRSHLSMNNHCTVLRPCPVCDEPDPHCEHRVNLAVAVCARCTPIQPATCQRILRHNVTDWPKTIYACALHRWDLFRGVSVPNYSPSAFHPLHDYVPYVHPPNEHRLPCSYCAAAHNDGRWK